MQVPFERRRRTSVAAIVTALLSFAMAFQAQAAENKVKVTLINGAQPEGENVASELRRILNAENDLRYIDEQELLDAGSAHDVTVETLRKGSSRSTHAEEFRRAMRAADIHAIFVLDVFSGKAQVVTIGPEGHEVSDERRALSGGSLPQKRAVSMLKAAFAELIPKWEKWREKPKKQASSTNEKESGSSSSGDKETDDSAATMEFASEGSESTKDQPSSSDGGETDAESEQAAGSGIDPGLEIWVGAVAGRHGLDVSSDSGYSIKQGNPFVGGSFELSAILGRFADRNAGFGVDVFGIYAPFQTALEDAGDGNEFSSSITQLGMELKYLYKLSRRLRFRLGTGFEALSLRITENARYTGNRYAQFRVTTGITFSALSIVDLTVGGGVAPIVNSDMSGGAFGQSAFAPAILGRGRLKLTPFDPVMISVGYSLYYYDLVFRDPSILASPVEVEDMYQLGTLKLSYRF